MKGASKRSAKGALEDHLRYRRRKAKGDDDDEATVAHDGEDDRGSDEEVEDTTFGMTNFWFFI